jgi:mannose-6-phosphate isomerase-like protein (cupin superfamily)
MIRKRCRPRSSKEPMQARGRLGAVEHRPYGNLAVHRGEDCGETFCLEYAAQLDQLDALIQQSARRGCGTVHALLLSPGGHRAGRSPANAAGLTVSERTSGSPSTRPARL